VVEGDNLSNIASRFNVSLDVLIAANPGIDPSFLSIGTELTIPAHEGSIAGVLPSPTPVALAFDQPQCYPTAAGDLWCFLLVENEQPNSLENLAALIHLYSTDGELVASQEAVALINALPRERRIPLVTFFESPVPAWTSAKAQILSAIAISDDDARYLPAEIQNALTEISDLGSSARIQGQINLPSGSPPANLIWIVAVAYDQDGIPVGVRRWERISEFPSGSSLNFDIEVFSLGPPIEKVELLFEVRP
jgi:LysM repeat protein